MRSASFGWVATVSALAMVWLMLTAGTSGWIMMGLPAIAASAWVLQHTGHAAQTCRRRWRWWRLPICAGLFVWQSIRGGIDISRRLLAPNMRLCPGMITIELRLPGEGARTLLALLVSLIPGGLSVRLEGHLLTLHTLDLSLPVEADTRRMEREIALLVGGDYAPRAAQ